MNKDKPRKFIFNFGILLLVIHCVSAKSKSIKQTVSSKIDN